MASGCSWWGPAAGRSARSRRCANSEVRNATTHGVLRLTLRDAGYDWRFVPIAGRTFSDAGAGGCHGHEG
jgi:hypothetical protein